MKQKKKKGFAGLLICGILALILLACGSLVNFPYLRRIPGYIHLAHGTYLSLGKFLPGIVFAAGIFLIGRKNEKKGLVIPLSIVNMLIALAAFIPAKRYSLPIHHTVNLLKRHSGTGILYLFHFVFIALIFAFTLLTMLAALKRKRRQPKVLCTLILAAIGIYAVFSIYSLMCPDLTIYGHATFRGIKYGFLVVKSFFYDLTIENPLAAIAKGGYCSHFLFPFATIPVLLAMFFAAKSIKPAEKAETAGGAVSAAVSSGDSGKSKVAAAVLAGVIGQLGVHRFYMKRAGSAVVQLLGGISFIIGYVLFGIAAAAYRPDAALIVFGLILFLFGTGTSIWAFVDFIRILCNRLMPANGVWSGWNVQNPAPQAAYHAPQPVQHAAETQASDELMRELRQLDEMRARGVISDEEYLSIRSRIENK